MIVRHARDFTWNRGCSSNSPPLTHGDQIPDPMKDSDNQIPSSPGRQRCQIFGVCPRGGGCWSFDLTDTLDSHINTLLFLTHLPTCQDGVENLDNVYFANHRQRDYKWFKIRSNTIDKRATIRDKTIAKLSLASLLLRAPQCWCNHSFSLHSLSSVIIIHMSLVALNKYDWQNFIQQGITRKVKK